MRNYIFYNKITFSAICALIAICTSSVCWSTTYYVDAAGGNDSNAGTATNSAWRTISKINTSTFSAGDSILFKRGETWREQLKVPSSGSVGNPITFGSYGSGNKPAIYGSETISNWKSEGNSVFSTNLTWVSNQIFQNEKLLLKVASKDALVFGSWYQDPSNMTLYIFTTNGNNPSEYIIESSKIKNAIFIYKNNFLNINNLSISKTNGDAVYIAYSSNIVINSCDVSNTFGIGILLENSSSQNKITNNNVSFSHYSTGNYQFYASNGITARYNSNENDINSNEIYSNYGSGVFIENSSNNTVRINNIHENGAGGIDINATESHGNLILNNTVFKNGSVSTTDQGISFFNSGINNIVRGNIVSGQQGGPDDGGGIAIDTTKNKVIVENNISYRNSGHGFIIWNSPQGIFRNNTSYNNSKNGFFIGGTESSGSQVTNNISSENFLNQISFQPDAVSAGGYTLSHNDFFKNGIDKVILFNDKMYSANEFKTLFPGSNLFQFDPIFISPVTNFNLSPQSPCIDKGIDVGLPFSGSSPDLGALEYVPSPSSPPKSPAPPSNIKIN